MFAFLFALFKSDEPKANAEFEREAVPHMDALYNFAIKMTGDSDDASDLLQETYLKAFRFWENFEKGTNCKAWLFRIMKNTFINTYRKNKKEPDKVDYEEIENFYENIKPSSTDSAHLEKDIYDNLLDDELSSAISSLPEDFRTVILLCDIEGYTYEAVSYTHLRAHETVLDLVCRLLLEKKKYNKTISFDCLDNIKIYT